MKLGLFCFLVAAVAAGRGMLVSVELSHNTAGPPVYLPGTIKTKKIVNLSGHLTDNIIAIHL